MTDVDPIYVAARRVLLNTLDILAAHRESLVVIGAQAVYLRTGHADLAVAPFTTDSDLAIDPSLLATAPPIEMLLSNAGFVPHPTEPGIWLAPSVDEHDAIPVDLIVPETLSPADTRRSAPLPGHAKNTLRKARGVEAAIVDHDIITISALDPSDRRSLDVKVAGAAALFIAKAHKIGERTRPTIRPGRLHDKDALDLYRLMTTHRSEAVAKTVTDLLLADERSRQVTIEGLQYLDQCFRSPASTGTIMATRALEGNVPAARVAAVMNPYVRALAQLLETIPETADDTRT